MRIHLLLAFLAVIQTGNASAALSLQSQQLTVAGNAIRLNIPAGLEVEFLAPMPQPRFMALGPDNELLVGTRNGTIYRLPWPYSSAAPLVTLNGYIHSVAYRNGKLFAAETAGLYSAPYSGLSSVLPAGSFARVTPLPAATGGHSSRTVAAGPDGRIYIGLGISGNCSDEYLDNSYPFERRRGGVFRLDEAGPAPRLVPYASGLRNPIGLAFHPQTGDLYATNAGPDNLGYDQPPEVLAALAEGSFHGMPWFQYMNGAFRSGACATSDSPRRISEAVSPAALFAARSTPEGIDFSNRSTLGPDFSGNAVVAIHGSWAVPPGGGSADRRPPKVVLVRFDTPSPMVVEDLITGFQRSDGSRFARPCGILFGPDGNLYFTSDSGEVTGLFRLKTFGATPSLFRSVAPANHLLLRNSGS